MFPHLSQDYSLEKLSKTDGFKIYSPVNADFKFETLDVISYTPEDIMDFRPEPPLKRGVNGKPTKAQVLRVVNQFLSTDPFPAQEERKSIYK
jgi:hypothetical protein